MKRTLSEDAWLASIGKHRGVAIRILDVFEEILESKGISIPDEDRTGEESEAHLFGMTYATLEDEVADLLKRYYDDCEPIAQPDHIAANKVVRSIAIKGTLAYEDIRSFETEEFFGLWDTRACLKNDIMYFSTTSSFFQTSPSESAFVLLPKTNFQYHHVTLARCNSLAELDDEVFKACLEHITSVSKSSAYTITGKYE